jgi:hypothetical protein
MIYDSSQPIFNNVLIQEAGGAWIRAVASDEGEMA